MSDETTIGAFSAEQAHQLSGVSLGQLRAWHRQGFLPASYADPDSRGAFSRIYSFKDIVTLRVLNQLRNVHRVSLQELRKAADALSEHGEDRWTKLRLFVLNRKVVVREPGTDRKREVTTEQYIVPIPIEVEVSSARQALDRLNERSSAEIGAVEKVRFVNRSAEVVAGTRIPSSVIADFAAAGYSYEEIISEYPTLTEADVTAALMANAAAA